MEQQCGSYMRGAATVVREAEERTRVLFVVTAGL